MSLINNAQIIERILRHVGFGGVDQWVNEVCNHGVRISPSTEPPVEESVAVSGVFDRGQLVIWTSPLSVDTHSYEPTLLTASNCSGLRETSKLIPNFNQFKDRTACSRTSLQLHMLNRFFLQRCPQTFGHRVAVTIDLLFHRRLMLCCMPCCSRISRHARHAYCTPRSL